MTAPDGTRMTYREAVKQAIREALAADSRVFLMGEDVGKYGGCFAVSKGLLDEFGEERIRDTPLSESAFVGAGIGVIFYLWVGIFSVFVVAQFWAFAADLYTEERGNRLLPMIAIGASRFVSHSNGW